MKRYLLLTCLLLSHALFAMEQPAAVSRNSAKKQEQLFAVLNHYFYGDKVDRPAVRKLLSEVDINYHDPAFDNETALMRAILHGNLTVISEILATPGLDTSIKKASGDAALHLAARSPEALLLLIESKDSLTPRLDLNQRGKEGMTTLCLPAILESWKQ